MRRGYYMVERGAEPLRGRGSGLATLAAQLGHIDDDRPAELVRGADAIAKRLGITKAEFYRLRSPDKRTKGVAAKMPVREAPGLGLVAEGAALDAWWKRYLRGEID